MQTESLERTLRDALRETLDREAGPHPKWTGSPAARRVAGLERRRRWPLRELAVAAVLATAGGAALLAGAANQPIASATGWVAFTVRQEDPAGDGPDIDIWFTALGQEPRRVVGTDTDGVDQVCPAFSPDGRSIAYGSIEGIGSGLPAWAYRSSALVVADVADDGAVAERLRIDVGDRQRPACAVWSPAGDLLAFGVPRYPSVPARSGEGSQVWILRPANRDITVIPDLLVTDLEWSPDGSVLAVAAGVQTSSDGLQYPRIHLYELSTGTLRTLDETLGATALTWSPDGGRIAYAGRGAEPASSLAYDSLSGLRIVDVRTGEQEVLTDPYGALHGLGPVWSPDGKAIAYQRSADVGGGAEGHEVVLLTADSRSENPGPASEVVMPNEVTTADGSIVQLWPWRVTWSPDGAYLMYVAWTHEQTVVVAVPTDPDAPAVILAEVDGIDAYDSAENTARVQIQVWQRQPAGPAR